MKRSTQVIIAAFIGIAVFTAMRLIMYFSYDEFHVLCAGDLLTVFVQGVRFDSSVLFIVLGPVLLMLLIPVPLRYWQKFWLWTAFCIFCACVVFLSCDILYYGHVQRHLSNEIYQLKNEGDFALQMMHQNIHLILLFLLVAAAAGWLWNKFTNISLRKEPVLKTAVKTVILIGCCVMLIRGTFSSKPISTIDAFAYGGNLQGNLILNGIMTTYRYGMKSGAASADYLPDKEAFQIIEQLFPPNENRLYPLRTKFEKGESHNVIILIMESWSAYYMGAYGAEYGVTPNFDALCKDGVLFMRNYAMQKRSIDGIQAVLTGIPRLTGMPSLGFGLEVRIKGNLGAIAKDNGFDTVFMQTSARRSYYMDSISKALGFTDYYGMEDYSPVLDYPNPKGAVFGWDYEGLDKFFQVLNSKENNFLGVFFSGTTHTPFARLPVEFTRYDGTDADEKGFLNTLYYADAALGNFIEQAKSTGWFDNTVFIITADHTLGKFEKTVFPGDYRIPLLIYAPAIFEPAVVDRVTTHLDLLPTAMVLAGLEGEVSSVGRYVLDEGRKSFAYIHMGDTAAAVTDDGFIHLAGDRVLNVSGDEKQLKAELQAYQQVVRILFDENRW